MFVLIVGVNWIIISIFVLDICLLVEYIFKW